MKSSMKIFKKDKDNKDKDNKDKDRETRDTREQQGRGRSTTASPALNISTSGSVDKEKALLSGSGGDAKKQQAGSPAVSTAAQIAVATAGYGIRIGDTRFYGRVICRARALYDYPLDGDTLQVEDGEIKLLKFRKGDIINVHEQDPSGWWSGEFNDEKGVFPGSYMKVLEEDLSSSEPVPTKKPKSQNVPREDLMRRVNELIKQLEDIEAERDEIFATHEREKGEFTRTLNEARAKSDTEIQQLRKALAERDDVIQASTKKIKSMERDLEEVSSKLAAKEVEVLTMELEIAEYKSKVPDMLAKQEREKKQNSLKGTQMEAAQRAVDLQDLTKQKLELEKNVRDAQAKLTELESKILKKVMSTPTPGEGSGASERSIQEKDKQIDLLKKQLGEEVFERRRLETEIRDMKRVCVDVENLKAEKQKLEADLFAKLEADSKLNKINIILQGLLNKDEATMSVGSMKEVLTKIRKGIATTPAPPVPAAAPQTQGTPKPEANRSLRPKTAISLGY